jgi:RNA-directed DNA polymerase
MCIGMSDEAVVAKKVRETEKSEGLQLYSLSTLTTQVRRIEGEETKSLPITREMVWNAWGKVKSNKGSAGVDQVSLEEYQQDLLNNLYKLWNRLSSGSYFPPSVREVKIPKQAGGHRKLGIPTVSDRIAQEVIKSYLEPRLEKEFHKQSYGYRPLKSAHQAIAAVRENVRHYAWVIDMDIKSFFDEVDHELLLKALDRHVNENWIKLYVIRWLEAPVKGEDGQLTTRQRKGTPQGGVISPLLSNLFLHYALDKWLEHHYPHISFVRYADDIIVHCSSEEEAKQMMQSLQYRLHTCHLRLNTEKTKIVYCQDYRREKKQYSKKFDFLGFRFQPRSARSNTGGMFLGFDCAISPTSEKRITQQWKSLKIHKWCSQNLQDIAIKMNPVLHGILHYYGKIKKWALERLARRFNFRLAKWALNKYKRFRNSYKRAYEWLREVRMYYPNLFYHWTLFKTM